MEEIEKERPTEVVEFKDLFKEVIEVDDSLKINRKKSYIMILVYLVLSFLGASIIGLIPGVLRVMPSSEKVLLTVAFNTNTIGIIEKDSLSDNTLNEYKKDYYISSEFIFNNSTYLVLINHNLKQTQDGVISNITLTDEEVIHLINGTNDKVLDTPIKLAVTDTSIFALNYSETPILIILKPNLDVSKFGFFLIQYLVLIICIGASLLLHTGYIINDFKAFFTVKTPGKVLTFAKGIGILIAVSLAAGILTQVLTYIFKLDDTLSINEKLIDHYLTINTGSALLMIGFVVILGPFVEEVVFRLSIFGITNGLKPIYQILISGVVFGLIHIQSELESGDLLRAFVTVIPYIGMGMAFGYTFSKNKKNLTNSFLIHAAWNAFSVAITLIGI